MSNLENAMFSFLGVLCLLTVVTLVNALVILGGI